MKESTKKIISAKLKGRVPWNKGIPRSSGTKKRVSNGLKKHFQHNKHSFLGRKHKKESIEKMKTSQTGVPSPNKGKKMGPCPEWVKKHLSKKFKGRKMSQEWKAKLSVAKAGLAQAGNRNPNWHGGIWKRKYPTTFNKKLKTAIRIKFNYICQLCGEEGLEVHHIDYNKDNCDESNLVLLCKRCHGKTNGKRDMWKKFFPKFLKAIQEMKNG